MLNKFLLLSLVLLPSSTNSCLGDHEPADFLIPPPAPSGQQSKKIHRSVTSFQFPPPPTVPPEIYNGQTDPPGLMQRVARWFGFGGGGYVNTLNNISPERTKDSQFQQTLIQPQQQQSQSQLTTQLQFSSPQHQPQHQQQHQQQQQQHHQQQHQKQQYQQQQQQQQQQQPHQQQQQQQQKQPQQQLAEASYYQAQYKENPLNSAPGPYQYNRPKANCNPCNKIPWLPMWPGNIPLLPGHIHNRPQLPQASSPIVSNNNFDTTLNPHPQNIQQSLGELPHSSSVQSQPHQQHQPHNQQHQQNNQQHQQQLQQQSQQHFDYRNENQLRAVRFNSPGSNLQLIPPPHLSLPPIPVPNLSALPLPPLYNAQPFREATNSSPAPSNNVPYVDHIEEPSELRPVTPTQISPNDFNRQHQYPQNYHQQQGSRNQGQFEIIKSVNVADFISSIEYPIKLTQSKVIDLTKDNVHSQSSPNHHKVDPNKENDIPKLIELGSIETTNTYVTESTSLYHTSQSPKNFVSQTSNNFVSQPTPHSIIQNQNFESNRENFVTSKHYDQQNQPNYQLNNQQEQQNVQNKPRFEFKNQQEQQNFQSETLTNFIQPPEQFDFIGPITSLLPPTRTNPPDFLSSPIIVHNHHELSDNYPEASSHNLTIKNENFLENTNYIQGPTILPQLDSIFATTTVSPIQSIQDNFNFDSTESIPTFDIIPSLETASEYPDLFKDYLEKSTKPPTTESPVFYNHNDDIFPGKPFTKDNDDSRNNINFTPWSLQPTPTSTYSSIDASGKYAGMSPPSEFQPPLIKFNDYTVEKRPKQIHQLIIPYTTKIKPRPFKLREQQIQQLQQQQQQQQEQQQQQQELQQQLYEQYHQPTQPHYENFDNRYSNWTSSQEHQEIHDQQESKLVTATQATDETTRKTTKYLTKILASNIRELLRREQAKRNKTNIDNNISESSETNNLKYLQKNIDDWTEQEYTSLKHKASTVSIQKPSKNIPNEYLTTTQSYHDIEIQDNIGATTQTPLTSAVPFVTKAMKTSTMLNTKDDFMAHLEDNSVFNVATNNRKRLEVYTKSYMKNRTSTVLPKTSTSLPSFILSSTITMPTSTTTTTTFRTLTSTVPFYTRNNRPTKPNEPWQKLKVSISPLTNEKVYVVTPVPRYQTKSTTPIDGIGTFKSPRFIVRPAPATNNQNNYSNNSSGIVNSIASATEPNSSLNQIEHSNTEKTIQKPYTPELFGLMGISAFVPDEPADILDGHSRVITVVTPTPHNKKRSIKYLELKRTTTSTRVLPLLSGNS